MDLQSYYFRQPVTEDDLKRTEEAAQTADRRTVTDFLITDACIASGLAVAPTAPETMRVVVAAGTGYEAGGERVRVPSPQTHTEWPDLDLAAAIPATPGDHRWVCISAAFARSEYDPRAYVDRLGVPQVVNYRQDESFAINVTQGVTGPAPARPTPPAGDIVLADVDLVAGMTQVLAGNLDVTRRAAAPSHTHRHAADLIDYLGSGLDFADGSGLSAGNLEAVLDVLVFALGQTASPGGAGRIGIPAASGTWMPISAGTVRAAILVMRSAIEAHIAPSGAIIGGDWEVGATGLGVDFWPIDRLELGGAPRSKAAATFTPVGLVADLWYYLYAKADGATGIAFEALSQADPANAPDLTLTWKSDGAGGVDRTRRYLGCVRTWNDAGTVRMLRARKLGRVYRYLEAVIAANRLMVINGLNSAGAWSAVQDCSTRIPPTSLQARLLLAISGAGGSPWVRLTDDTADGDKAHLRAIATAHTDLWGEVWCPVSPAQGVYVYTTAGDGGLAVSAHVLGFEE